MIVTIPDNFRIEHTKFYVGFGTLQKQSGRHYSTNEALSVLATVEYLRDALC